MAETFRVVCASKQHAHRHIMSVGTGTDDNAASLVWTVAQVRRKLGAGNRFYTTDSRGRDADVERWTCNIDNCTYETIRTNPDQTTDNNLDQIRDCR
jgi:hypothetical protein